MEKHIVMDWSSVRFQDIKVLLVSIPAFLLYALILNIVCSVGEIILIGLLFLIVQLTVGMTTTRIFYRLGMITKNRLSFLDPASLSNGWIIEEKEIHSVEISLIFEKFYNSIKEADKKSIDDINDVAWFFIAVWSMFATLLVVTWETFYPYCLFSSIVLAVISFFTYYGGRKSGINGYFEDDINHLEYHVQSRLEGISSLHPAAQSFVYWKKKNGIVVLNDFSVHIDYEGGRNSSLRYFLGLPSNEHERILIDANVTSEKIQEVVKGETNWKLQELQEKRYQLSNMGVNLDLRFRRSYVRSPEKPKYLFDIIRNILKVIAD